MPPLSDGVQSFVYNHNILCHVGTEWRGRESQYSVLKVFVFLACGGVMCVSHCSYNNVQCLRLHTPFQLCAKNVITSNTIQYVINAVTIIVCICVLI
jgi:hypothetical protein